MLLLGGCVAHCQNVLAGAKRWLAALMGSSGASMTIYQVTVGMRIGFKVSSVLLCHAAPQEKAWSLRACKLLRGH